MEASAASSMPTNTVLPTAGSSSLGHGSNRHSTQNSNSSWRVTRALLAKNWIVKKRHAFATASEILNPLLFILLFVALKSLEQDLDIPGGWAINTANKTIGTANTTGSHWNLYATSNLLADLNSSLQDAGLGGMAGNASSSSPSEILNQTLPLLTSSSSPFSLVALTSQLKLPRFYFTETTMPGLMLNLALQSLSEATRLEELSQRDLLLCVAKFVLLGFTSLTPTSLYAMPFECQGKIVPYKLAITPDNLYTRQYVSSILEHWYPRLALVAPVLGISPLTTPSFEDSRVFFHDEKALETYLASEDYGLNLTYPKIYAAIAFQTFPLDPDDIGDIQGHDISFSVRMNSTYTDTSFPNSVPRTVDRKFNLNQYLRSVKAQNTLIYATRGFLTLQTMVMRVLNCLPAWHAPTQSVLDATQCQLRHATMVDDDTALDDRLLQQLDQDLILGTILAAVSGLSGVAQQLIKDGNTSTLQDPGEGDLSSILTKAIQEIGTAVASSSNSSISSQMPAQTKRNLLRVLRIAPQAFHGASVYMSPTEAFHYAGFYVKIMVVFPIGFMLSYLYGVSRVIVALLMEKETKSRELMKILGIHDIQLIGTWLTTYVQLFFISSVLQTIGASAFLFPHSSGFLLFLLFFSFALSTFGFGFVISTLFDRARVGSFVGMGLFFMMFFVSFSFTETTSEISKSISCLLSPVALAQGITILAQLESTGIGLTIQNANDPVNQFRFITAIWMQFLDFGLYLMLGWYLEKVMPKEFGIADQKWFFLFTSSYWTGKHPKCTIQMDKNPEENGDHSLDIVQEDVPQELLDQEKDARAIVISGLRKEFPVPGNGSVKVAVKSLTLSLYEGQITCLLGHNGAGKTTLIAMLTGMTPPTSGEARIRGVSITTSGGIHEIRQSLGFCPQFSVVYPELTVEEHLVFYAKVKNHDLKKIPEMINEVGLKDKRHVQVHALSGGMKRKLSLAISFLGDSRVVFLDEPTSGMDPYSRTFTWELIQRHKTGRIIILTTHFMDEADLLGDRIAILANGQLKCVGSSLFLKNRYGVGYKLSFVVLEKNQQNINQQNQQNQNQQNKNTNQNQQNKNTKCDIQEQLRELVTRHVPGATLATDIGTELTFQLPFDGSGTFPALFEEIDLHKEQFGVASYAISVTTLEEIFLKVASEASSDSHPAAHKKPMDPSLRTVPLQAPIADQYDPQQATQAKDKRCQRGAVVLFFVQLRALFLKRFLSAKRDRGMLFYSILLPIVVLFTGLSALKMSLWTKNDPHVVLTTTSQFTMGRQTPLPVTCLQSETLDPWCDTTLAYLAQDAVPFLIDIEPIVYDGNPTPTVFNITYNSPQIAPNDTTGYCLRFAQLAFERGYGKDSETMGLLATPPIEGQYGGLLLYVDATKKILSYNLLVNSSATHGAPIYKALADQAIHNLLLQAQHDGASSSSPSNRKITVATHPFPLSFKTKSIFGSFLSLPAVMFVLIAFTFIPAAMMPFLVKEKHHDSNARHQQLLSGVSLPAYWLANLLFDLLLYAVPMVVAILLLRFYGISSSLSGTNASKTCTNCTQNVPEAVVALFICFGTAVAPWTYALSHLLHDPSACLLYTVMLNFFFGLVLLLTSYSLDSLDSTREANTFLVFVWRCSPLFALSNGLLRVILADLTALFGFSNGPQDAFSTQVAGYEIAYLAIEGPVFLLITLAVDAFQTRGNLPSLKRVTRFSKKMLDRWTTKAKTKTMENDPEEEAAATRQLLLEDPDVRAERERVLDKSKPKSISSSSLDEDVVSIRQLHKTYKNGKKAVSNLTFGLPKGDCFGFLGINGAGKTTTLKMLTGDLFPSFGTGFLNGYEIVQDRASVRKSIGYCPQFDALLELLTVREHLELYGRLKGFDGKDLSMEIQKLLTQFQLFSFENKLSGSLSGGNKRKLSVAIAMLGEPALLFLDEPSTGMDPFSRRFMWDIILQVSVQSRKSTIVLTTHSMEECEALCTRAGIMVGGKLQCFGSIPHLKERFGNGFLLECKLETPRRETVDLLLEDLVLVHGGGGDGAALSMETIHSTQIQAVCTALGKPQRAAYWLQPGSSKDGEAVVVVVDQSSSSGEWSVNAREFCAWWLLEDRVARLTAFLRTQFHSTGGATGGASGGASVVLMERRQDFCRFKLAPTTATTGPPPGGSGGAAADPADQQPSTADTTTSAAFSVARMFRLIEDARRELCVKEYSISQTSLEQIFNAFARQQQE